MFGTRLSDGTATISLVFVFRFQYIFGIVLKLYNTSI